MKNQRSKTYSVGELARLSGVTARAIRHYEEVGLLAPQRSENGYRAYTAQDAHKLAQILSMRSCGLSLQTIRSVFDDPNANLHEALCSHLLDLHKQRGSLNGAIDRTEKAIATIERMENMDAETAFEKMKSGELEKNEREYGREARERYGADAVNATNERLKNLTRDEWESKELLEDAIKVQLRIAMATEDPASEESQELARMHAKWLRMHWGDAYLPEMHLGLAQGYLQDERFVAYYDNAAGEGATKFLVASIEENIR